MSEPWRLRTLPSVAALAYAAGIWWLSSGTHAVGGDSALWGFLSNAFHFPLFGGFAVLLAESLKSSSGLSVSARVRCLGIVVAYGMIDELHQASVPGRTPDPGDVATDALGGLAFLLLWWGVRGPGRWRIAVLRFSAVSAVALALVAFRVLR